MAVYGTQVADIPPRAIGLLAGAVPLGTILGTLIVRAAGGDASLLRLVGTISVFGGAIALAVFAVEPGMPLVVVAFMGAGVTFAATVPANAVAGRRIPDDVRASVFSVLQGFILGAHALGAVVGGLAASWLGVANAMVGASIGLVGVGLLGIAAVRAMEPVPEPVLVAD